MKRQIAIIAAAIAAIAFTFQTADAGSRRHKVDKRVKVVALATTAGSAAAFLSINHWHWNGWHAASISRTGAWAGTTMGCAAASPVVATMVVNRPLTTREAYYLVGSCVVPVVGGWLVNRWFDANPQWEGKGKKYGKRGKKKKK